MENNVVLFESPEAATYRTDIKGWVSRNGHYYGDGPSNERTARWAGCTHMTCECGKEFEKGSLSCAECRDKAAVEAYYDLPVVKWDLVTPLAVSVLRGEDKFFFHLEDVLDYAAQLQDESGHDELRLILCKPGHLHTLSEYDWCDDLPEDGELPTDVALLVEQLNEAIRKAAPVCWWPSEERISADQIWDFLNDRKTEEVAGA
jgi:hypothetical protein